MLLSPALARHVRTNEDLIFVKKVPVNSIDSVINRIDSNTWEVGRASENLEFHNGFIKVCSLYEDPCTDSNQEFGQQLFDLCWQEFLKISPGAQLVSIERGIMSWSHTRSYMSAASPHSDSTAVSDWSFLIHLKGNSGDTNFYTDPINEQIIKTVKFEPGNLIMFPSLYHHQGLLPDRDDRTDRYIANFIVRINTELNQQVLIKSPTSLQKIARS